MKQHDMHLTPKNFLANCYDGKDIEFRLYDEKRKKLTIGNIITFTNIEDETMTFTVKITGLFIAKNFSSLFKIIPHNVIIHEMLILKFLNGIYPEEAQNKYGVIGIKFKILAIINFKNTDPQKTINKLTTENALLRRTIEDLKVPPATAGLRIFKLTEDFNDFPKETVVFEYPHPFPSLEYVSVSVVREKGPVYRVPIKFLRIENTYEKSE